MDENKKRGFKRLAWALGIPYFAFMAVAYWRGMQNVEEGNSTMERYASGHDNAYLDAMFDAGLEQYQLGQAQMEMAFSLGVLLPIIVAVLVAVGFWIYRGFKPKVEAAE